MANTAERTLQPLLPVPKLIVKNLPDYWLVDDLRSFLEDTTDGELCVESKDIYVFQEVSSTALLSLDKQLEDHRLRKANNLLSNAYFGSQSLRLEPITMFPTELLVEHKILPVTSTQQRLVDFFQLPESPIKHCDVDTYRNIGFAVVGFKSTKDAQRAKSRKLHHPASSDVVSVDLWYEQFHRPVLRRVLASAVFEKRQCLAQIRKLKAENERMKDLETERLRNEQKETLARMDREHKKMVEDLNKMELEDMVEVRQKVPSYQIPLMVEFALKWERCQVMLLRNDEEVLFFGSEEECEEAQQAFNLKLKRLVIDSMALSKPMVDVFKTQEGSSYLQDILTKHPLCSASLEGDTLSCAAKEKDDLWEFQSELNRNILRKICEVPASVTSSSKFSVLKSDLEKSGLVKVTSSAKDSVTVEGLNGFGDVNVAVMKLEEFTSLNRTGTQQFQIAGSLEAQSAKQWFSKQLEEAKALIMQNGRVVKENESEKGYLLTYECRVEVLEDVIKKLNDMKSSVFSTRVDLNAQFSSLNERALVVNGIHRMGKNTFCVQLIQSLVRMKKIKVDFKLPNKLSLPLKPGKAAPASPFEGIVCTTSAAETQKVVTALLKMLRSTFLCTETVRDLDTYTKMEKKVQQGIVKTAAGQDVILSETEEGLNLCGRKENVLKVLSEIRSKMLDHVMRMSSQNVKKRKKLGLPVEVDHLPKYWKLVGNVNTASFKATEGLDMDDIEPVDVMEEERKAVEELMRITWEQEAKPKVLTVERLENPELFRTYSQRREQLFNDLAEQHTSGQARFSHVESMCDSKRPVLTTKHIDPKGILARDMYQQVNEHYLFHGTKANVLTSIFAQGLDFRLAAVGNFGKGVYGAESPCKSNQYVGYGVKKMFLMRVLLGEPYLIRNQNTGLVRPPCMNCRGEVCADTCPGTRLYNSVIFDNTGHREFIVYDQDVCYPEYLITYN